MSLALREMRVDQVKRAFSLVDFFIVVGILLIVVEVKRVFSVVDFPEMTFVTNQS